MKFCPVVPEICRGQVHGPRKERKRIIIIITRYDYNLTIMKSPKLATDTIYPHIKFWWYRTMLNFYRPFFMPCFWQPFWKFWKCRIAPLMVTYHYVKFYVSIIIHLEVININVRNFNFSIGFNSNPYPPLNPSKYDWPPLPQTDKAKNFRTN